MSYVIARFYDLLAIASQSLSRLGGMD
jgi:hypothetical protein